MRSHQSCLLADPQREAELSCPHSLPHPTAPRAVSRCWRSVAVDGCGTACAGVGYAGEAQAPPAGLAELLRPGRPLRTARRPFLQSHPCRGKRAASVSSRGSSYVTGQEARAGTWGRKGTRVYLRVSARGSGRVCRHRPSGAEAAGPTLSPCRCVLLGSRVRPTS